MNAKVVHSGRPSSGRIDSALRGEWDSDVIRKMEQAVQAKNWVTMHPAHLRPARCSLTGSGSELPRSPELTVTTLSGTRNRIIAS